MILTGAEKVSVNSEAMKNPGVIRDGARAFGNQCIVLGGAGNPEHLLDVLTRGKADAAMIASMVHYRTLPSLK